MEVIWSPRAKDALADTLEYWDIHNNSTYYSDKIIQEIDELLKTITNKPLYLGRYSRELQMYVRDILKGRFLIYFTVNEVEDLIEIHYFRGVKQQSIE